MAETAKPASDLKMGSVQLREPADWNEPAEELCRPVEGLCSICLFMCNTFLYRCNTLIRFGNEHNVGNIQFKTAVESINSQLPWQLKEVGCAQHWNLHGPRFPKSWCAAGCEPASHEPKDTYRYLTVFTVECCCFMMNYNMNHNRWFAYLYHLQVEVEPKSWNCLHVIYLPMT